MNRNRDFYVADSFDRSSTMCFADSETTAKPKSYRLSAYDNDTCITFDNVSINDEVMACNCISNAQGTSSTVTKAYTSDLDSMLSVKADVGSVDNVSNSIREIGKTLKVLGNRMGLAVDDFGKLIKNEKMVFKSGLQRGDLLTLKRN